MIRRCAIEELWWRQDADPPRGLLVALAAGEVAFRAGLALRRAWRWMGLSRAARAGVPVVSIGNLAVGGAGKTPAVLAVVERLAARGRRVAVLSRGYGARRRDARVVSDGGQVLLGAEEAGDEPVLLARRLPGTAVLCGPRRDELARRAVDGFGSDVLVLDDGFQHLRLARDLDVVVIDAADPVGNGHLLPRGPNREPWSALRRADVAWLSRVDVAEPGALQRLRERVRETTGLAPVESRHTVTGLLDGSLSRERPPDALAGRRVLLLCALARPDGFRRTLADLGAEVAGERVFRDHHRFTNREAGEIASYAAGLGCDAIAATEKDAVRFPRRLSEDPSVVVVRIASEIVAGSDELDRLLDRILVSRRESEIPSTTSTRR